MLHIILKRLIGVILLFLGIVFLVTPLTPGAGIFIFFGLEFLGLGFLIPEKVRAWIHKYWEELKEWMKKKISSKK